MAARSLVGAGPADGADAQAGLLAALLDGIFETPLWATFMDRLRHATAADLATIVFHPPGRPVEDAVQLFSTGAGTRAADPLRGEFQPVPSSDASFAEGRAQTLADVVARYPRYAIFFRDLGVVGLRTIRVREASGIDAHLAIARGARDFTPGDTALLEAIAPSFRSALRIYIEMERERFSASLTADAVRRLQFGWFTLDGSGRILGADVQGASLIAGSGVIGRTADGQLSASSPELKRRIHAALERIVADPRSRPVAVNLSRDPWLDMLIMPARKSSISDAVRPAAIAYVHGDSWHSDDRWEVLSELFQLSPREARLALALSRGLTIAEAALAFGLAVQSIRTYSKNIYAKTGARGLPDLVRIVMRSVMATAPDGDRPPFAAPPRVQAP